MCIVLDSMSVVPFNDIVGEQAEKSSKVEKGEKREQGGEGGDGGEGGQGGQDDGEERAGDRLLEYVADGIVQ